MQSILSFNGNGRVDLGVQPVHAIARDLTIEAWIKVRAQRAWAGVISKIYDTGKVESGYGMLLDGKSGVYFGLKVAGRAIDYLSSGANTISVGKWQHVAMSYDGKRMCVYIDGELKATRDVAAAAIDYAPAHYLRLGEYRDNNESHGFNGRISEMRLWACCRSAEEIAAGRGLRLRGDEAGLVGYWPLDEGSGTTARDESGSAHAGSIASGEWEDQLPLRQPQPDDLTKIEGIGPKICELLRNKGLITFTKLAATPVEQLDTILSEAGSHYGMAVPTTWPEQAVLAAAGKWDELDKLQGELKSGRRR